MKNKRGQFYLIAAMIIVLILVTFVVVSNYSDKKEYYAIDELSQQLKIESSKVLDYDSYNSEETFENFTKNFSEYAGINVEIYYIIGREGNIQAYRFDSGEKIEKQIEEVEGEILITIDSIDYTFEIKPGENFYYIISQKINGAKHVVTN